MKIIGSALVLLLAYALYSGSYYIKQGFYLLLYTAGAVPNSSIISDPMADYELREFLRLAEQINEFGRTELGLNGGRNYTRYSAIGRSHLAYVVSAAEPFSLNPYTWKYPLVGRLPYKGFFRIEEAYKEAEKMRQNYDVWVRGVGAFSTLGFLADPLFCYMMNYPVHTLADMILHEQAHATLFIRGEGSFNEQFAVFVGNEGSRLFIEQVYGRNSPEYMNMLDTKYDRDVFLDVIFSLRNDLEAFYSSMSDKQVAADFDPHEHKNAIISRHQKQFAENHDDLFRTESYRWFSETAINNAFISMFVVYSGNLDRFYNLYGQFGHDMAGMIAYLQGLGRKAPERVMS